MENGRLIEGKPSYDNSATWTERVHDELFAFDNADVSINGDDGEQWSLHFENLKTAGVATWRRWGRVRAVVLTMTGISDAVDADAVARCTSASAPFFPAEEIAKAVAKLHRPASMHLFTDQKILADRLINTVSTSIAKVLFHEADVTTNRKPLASNLRAPGEIAFALQNFASDSSLQSEHLLAYSDLMRQELNRELISLFDGWLERAADLFDLNIGVNEVKMKLFFRSLGKSAGGVWVYNSTSADEPEATSLLLSGLDPLEDVAALAAHFERMPEVDRSEAWARRFEAIGKDKRPLLPRFLSDKIKPTELGERISGCFAGAFFRWKKVL